MPAAQLIGDHLITDTELIQLHARDRDDGGPTLYRKARWCETHDCEATTEHLLS